MTTTAHAASAAEQYRDLFLSEESGLLVILAAGQRIEILFDRGLVAGRSMIGSGGVPTQDAVALVKRAFGAAPESVEFQPQAVPEGEPVADTIETAELFLEGIRALYGFEEIREALSARTNALTMKPNATVPLERLRLRPVHGFILSRLTGSLTFQDVTSTVGADDEDEASRFLYGLLLLGSIAFDPPMAPGIFRTETLLSDRVRDSAREETESSFIRDTYKQMLEQSAYQILGVTEITTAEEVRKSYDERRRLLVAERFLPHVRETLRAELSTIETRLTEVYLALVARAPLRAPAPEEERLDLGAATLRREMMKTEIAANFEESAGLAEGYYAKAKKFFAERDFHNCIQYCQQAIRQNDNQAKYHCLLAEAQSRNPDRRWQKMAEQSYLQAIRLDPWSADLLVTLGQFYKRQGLSVRARRQFERALEIQPGHGKAKEELASLR